MPEVSAIGKSEVSRQVYRQAHRNNAKQKRSFLDYENAGFGPECLPIIPVGAALSPDSSVPPDNIGKVPGRLVARDFTRQDGKRVRAGWLGYAKWTDVEAAPKDLKLWQSWKAGVGMQGRKFPAVDIDVDDKKLSREIEKIAYEQIGAAARRDRTGSYHCLLMYRAREGVTLRKRSIVFMVGAVKSRVELLATGQYYNVEGSTSKGEYAWPDWHPCDGRPEDLTEIDAAKVDAFFAALGDLLDLLGYPVVSDKGSSTGAASKHRPIGSPELMASDPADVLALLKACSNADNDYDEFIRLLPAIKSSFGEAAEDYYPQVEAWALTYEENTPEVVRDKWESFHDAALGWSYLEAWGRSRGYTGDAQRAFADTPQPSAAASAADPENPTGSIPETEIEKALRQYVWVQKLERYVHLATGEMLSTKAFNAANVRVASFGRSGVQSAEAEFQNHPKAGNSKAVIPTYRPGRGVSITDTNERGRSVKAVNLWRPSSLVPASNVTNDDVRPWLDHVKLIFGELDGAAVAHFLNFVAFLLQRPGEKINHALVIVGKTQGTGKDTAFVPVIQAIGLHNVATITPEVLAGPWTHYLLAQLVRAEEMMNFGRRELANKLKPMLCTPPEMVSINTKNVKQYDIPNLQNWIMFTNHEDALSIEDTDRRYWVHKCCLEAPCEPAYYAKLYGWYDAGGCEKVAGWLLQRDLGAFNPMSPPPATEAKRAMSVQSQSKQVRWSYEALTVGDFAGRSIVLYEDIKAAADDFDGDAPTGVNPKNVAVAFKAAGFKQMSWHTKIDGRVRQLWVRDQDGSLSRLSADQLRAKYLAERARGAATEAA